MPNQRINNSFQNDGELPSLPMAQSTWQAIVETLAFSPQQTRIVELILRGNQDKQIASQLGLTVPTVRTYLKRIFDRVEVSDRLTLVLRIFALAQQEKPSCSCHRKV